MSAASYESVQARLQGRMDGLDALRGIAVTWVVWHNCTYDFKLDGMLAKVLAFITNCGWLGVQLFFVLSGF